MSDLYGRWPEAVCCFPCRVLRESAVVCHRLASESLANALAQFRAPTPHGECGETCMHVSGLCACATTRSPFLDVECSVVAPELWSLPDFMPERLVGQSAFQHHAEEPANSYECEGDEAAVHH